MRVKKFHTNFSDVLHKCAINLHSDHFLQKYYENSACDVADCVHIPILQVLCTILGNILCRNYIYSMFLASLHIIYHSLRKGT